MATVTVTNVDAAVVERWQRIAAENHRSLDEELRDLLERPIPGPMSWADAKAAAETIRQQVPISPVTSDVLIRQMRDER